MLSLLHSKTSSSKKRKMTTNLQPSLPSKKKTNDSSSGTMRRLLERIKVLNMSIIRKGDEKLPNLVSANSFAFCFAWDWLVGEGGWVVGRSQRQRILLKIANVSAILQRWSYFISSGN